ncbi:hypothetical protein Bhyg_02915 [Pseudolycoriella hygida]|uniref:Uncharacterized protein n=1 Tax=Pseudolycoriella hygida TaxID=35572 RepID=A0A9Q0S6Z8_9DIPT|nr:hypothetical protein Bhyg_02915 [Pseudolycoriella hygida]
MSTNSGNTKRKTTEETADVSGKWTTVEKSALQKLIDTGALTVNDCASKVKACDSTFNNFSNNVIGYHLGIIRKKMISGQSSSAQNGASVHDILT